MEEYIQHALDIVKIQAGLRPMTEEEICSMAQKLAVSFTSMYSIQDRPEQSKEFSGTGKAGKKSAKCLECQRVFRVLTRTHLQTHGLTVDAYREKWGYGKKEPLQHKAARRRAKQQEVSPAVEAQGTSTEVNASHKK